MKEKMLQIKKYVIAHKKQIVIATGLGVVAIISGKLLVKKFQENGFNNETVDEITGGVIEKVTDTKEL